MSECRKKTEDVKRGIHKRAINEVEVSERPEEAIEEEVLQAMKDKAAGNSKADTEHALVIQQL